MTRDWLIHNIRQRIADPQRRTDRPGSPPLGPRATPALLAQTRLELGFSLHPLLECLLLEIGNGGFGPGDGLVGACGGTPDRLGRDLVVLRTELCFEAYAEQRLGRGSGFPDPVVPLCHWVDEIIACMDSRSGRILVFDGSVIRYTPWDLHDWLNDWAAGATPESQAELLRAHWLSEPGGLTALRYRSHLELN